MIKPLWALGAAGVLVAAGVAGAVVVASSGGEDDAVQQAQTSTPTRGAAKDPPGASTQTPPGCDPNTSRIADYTLFRWGDVAVQLPPDGRIQAFGSVANDHSGPILRLSLYDETYIDATTGAIIHRTYVDPTTGASLPLEDVPEPEMEAVLATVSVCPFDRSAAPWPYNGDPPTSTPQVLDRARYVEPDPSSGIQVLIGGECALGCRDTVAVRSAYSEMQIDAQTGELWLGSTRIADEDREAFERYRASIRFEEAQ